MLLYPALCTSKKNSLNALVLNVPIIALVSVLNEHTDRINQIEDEEDIIPQLIQDGIIKNTPVDGWGNRLLIMRTHSLVVSKGKDGKLGTSDDIMAPINKNPNQGMDLTVADAIQF